MNLISTATVSDDGMYRYDLTRGWGPGRWVLWIMLNPSTADAMDDDPTVRRCRGFTRAWGYSGLVVVNLYAYRATNPHELIRADDPIGPANKRAIEGWLRHDRVDLAVAAWGARWADLGIPRLNVEGMGRDLWCLGRTKGGHPRHPLYLHRDCRPTRYTVASRRGWVLAPPEPPEAATEPHSGSHDQGALPLTPASGLGRREA